MDVPPMVIGSLIFLFFILAYTVFGDRGLVQLMHLQSEVNSVKKKIVSISDRNQALRAEVKRLKSDRAHMDRLIRQELGMVGDGEIIYRFVE